MSEILDLIDINKKKGLPRTYKFNQFIRWFTIILAVFAISYSLTYIFYYINPHTSNVKKAIPFIILFLAINSLLKNLFTLNKIVFTKDDITFKYLAKKPVTIKWHEIKKMSFPESRQKIIKIHYVRNGEEKDFDFNITFPKMLEIINSIAEMNKDIEYDKFLQNIVVTEQEKNLMKLRPVNFKKKENEEDKN